MKLRLLALTLAFSSALAADAGFKSIFNGQDLAGWEGLPAFWSVKDGAITGQTTPENPTKTNTFLVYRDAQPANFELRLMFRLTPNNDKKWGNSGVQYRSKIVDAAGFVVAGYQADIDSDGRYTGMLYEEKGRSILMGPGDKIRVKPVTPEDAAKKKKASVEKLDGSTPAKEVLAAYKIGDWNELTIVARGNHVQHFLNGKPCADMIDDDPALAPKSGVIALQLHQGQPMTIQFKNLRLKTLP